MRPHNESVENPVNSDTSCPQQEGMSHKRE